MPIYLYRSWMQRVYVTNHKMYKIVKYSVYKEQKFIYKLKTASNWQYIYFACSGWKFKKADITPQKIKICTYMYYKTLNSNECKVKVNITLFSFLTYTTRLTEQSIWLYVRNKTSVMFTFSLNSIIIYVTWFAKRDHFFWNICDLIYKKSLLNISNMSVLYTHSCYICITILYLCKTGFDMF